MCDDTIFEGCGKKHFLLAVLLCMVIFLVSNRCMATDCNNIIDQTPARQHIVLFKYHGTVTDEANNHFSLFQGILRVKLRTLIEELQASTITESTPQGYTIQNQNALAYLNDLGLYLPGGSPAQDTLTTLNKTHKYWNDAEALELMRGMMIKEDPYIANSEIYIGSLSGCYNKRSVNVSLPVQPESVPSTNDSHSLVTIYALAMDALRLNRDMSIVKALLAQATSILKDLKRRHNGQLLGDLEKLENAIEKTRSNLP